MRVVPSRSGVRANSSDVAKGRADRVHRVRDESAGGAELRAKFINQPQRVETLNSLFDALPGCLLDEHRPQHHFPAPVLSKNRPPMRLVPIVLVQPVINIEQPIGR